MSVPLKNRLSYIWAQACGQDRLYSRIFNETDSYEVTRVNNIHVFFPGAAHSHNIPRTYQDIEYVSYSTWLEARPAAGEKDKFFLSQHEHGRGVDKVYTRSLPCSREDVIRLIRTQEQEWKNSKAKQAHKQPFSAKFAIK